MPSRQGSGSGGNQSCCGGEGFCGFLFTVGLLVLIYWAIFQPHHIRATVDSTTLSNLTVSNSNASSVAEVSYNLAVNLNLYNPSVRVNIYYDTIDAKLRFRDAVLGPAANGTSPSEFYQRRKASDGVKLEFDYGRPGVGVSVDVAGELQKEMSNEAPVVRLELDVDVRVRYVFRIFKLRQKPRIWCSLSIPVKAEGPGPAVGGAVASGERCRVKY
ncbi:NDR1/HIN1-like protein 3 [Miscanthus floridulus]|uniref:NDR1/HIN1-like protein 3 n=1 Tax=Miscanthus floridulus TaxID=154761 RepID=UPI003458ABD3